MIKVAVITPTTGRKSLSETINSVKKQKVGENIFIEHFVVFDGEEYSQKYTGDLSGVKVVHLPFNTGRGGNYGQRIMGGLSIMVDSDWICYLDDDNTFCENHIQTCIEFSRQKDWVFSLRRLIVDGEFYGNDLYESLGPYKTNYPEPYNILIDNNCYFLKKEIAVKMTEAWLSGWGADRIMAKILCENFPRYACTFLHTVNYSIKKEHLSLEENRPVEGASFVFHLSQEATLLAIQNYLEYQKQELNCSEGEEPYYDPQLGQKQWQQNFFIGCPFNICNGFELWKYAPSGSTFIFTLFDKDLLPKGAYERKDVLKILYTIESPNVNYIKNWDEDFLKNFDRIITYWEDAEKFTKCRKYPFVNKLNFSSSCELEMVFPKGKKENSVCCVLQNRPAKDSYSIRGVTLKSLDYLRLENMTKLFDSGVKVMCYGDSWSTSGLPFTRTKNRFLDQEYVTDIYKNHKWVYISENTNAKGYMSEKIFDALMAGCIPIYICSKETHGSFWKFLKRVAICVGYEEDIAEKFNEFRDFVPDKKDVAEFLKFFSIDSLLFSGELEFD